MNAAQHILIFGVRVYRRTLSPVFVALSGSTGCCRFEPSCSQYAIEAIQMHGAIKGGVLAAWRLLRCAPWGGCGEDPVPREFKVQGLRFKVATHCCHASHEVVSGGRS